MELKEAQVARQAAEQRCAELDAALKRTEQELESLRRRYAELYIESRAQQQRLEYIELRAAGLLADREDPDSGRALSQAVRALDEICGDHAKLYTEISAFGAYLQSVLDVVQPSDALRHEVMDRFRRLLEAAERSVKPLSRVAGRGSGQGPQRQSRVLAVNDELQIVVLDSGFDDGVRQGTTWRLLQDGKILARLTVVETRSSISAALVTEGRFQSVAPGASVTSGD